MVSREAAWAMAWTLVPFVIALAACTFVHATSPPPCSADTPEQPCLLRDKCERTGPRQVKCMTKVVAQAKIGSIYSWDYNSPPFDISVSITEATGKDQMHFIDAVINMEVPLSREWKPFLAQFGMISLPMREEVIDLLNGLHHFELALSSFVDIAGVTSTPDNNDLLLRPKILQSADWSISMFKAECSNPVILNSTWNILENKFNLTHLVLQRCHLNFHMKKQPYLQHLEIINCNIQNLPTDFFERMPNILSLSLSTNNFTTLPNGTSQLKNLQQLELLGNNLISAHSFSSDLFSITNLQILHLSKTPLMSLLLLDPLLKTNSLKLTGLHLLECQLTSLQEEDIKLLSKQTKLEILDLSNNKIDYIPFNWSDLPPSVKILNLSSNLLTEVQFIFSSDSELKVIDISKNKLKVIGDLLTTGKAEYFNISFNNIIEVCGLNYGRNINNLNLSHNMIQITEQSVASLSTLQSIDLGGNYFNCQDCNITFLQKWVSGQHNTITALNDTGDLFCFPKHRNLRVTDVKQEKCQSVLYERNPEWARVFQISLVLSLIFLLIVLLQGYKFETCYLMRLWKIRSNKTRRTSENYHYDAFICYSNADREWVIYELMKKLEGAPHNYKFCDHERDFILGSFITQNIIQSMHRSRHILFVISETFFNSQWCIWELEMARHREFEGGGSSPILLELTPVDQLRLSENIEVLLDSCKSIHTAPLFWDKLVNALGPSLANSSERVLNIN